jgi:hypothetical protein
VIVTDGECTDTTNCIVVDLVDIESHKNLTEIVIYPSPGSVALISTRLKSHFCSKN